MTLIEMMIVVSILGIVATMAVPNLSPVIFSQRLAASTDEAAGALDRARRLALATGRCYRVRLDNNVLLLERRSNGDCITNPANNWDPPMARTWPLQGVTFSLDNPAAGQPWIIFRPNGRLRGNANHIITDDGARVRLTHASLTRQRDLFATTGGRICGNSSTAATPMPDPIICGSGFSGGGGGGGGCAAAASSDSSLWLGFGLGILFLRRGRLRRGRLRRTPAKKALTGKTAPGKARGYLLIEVMVGGAMLAVLLGSTIGVIASARAQISRASHRAVAAEFAQQWLQHLLTDTTTPCPAASDIPKGGFTRTCAVDVVTLPNTFGVVERVTVTVQYPSLDGEGQQTTTHSALRRTRPFRMP